ncbi:MAG: PEP-utilizing enzyme [archaeon]
MLKSLNCVQRKANMVPSPWAWLIATALCRNAVPVVYRGHRFGSVPALWRRDTMYWCTDDESNMDELAEYLSNYCLAHPDHMAKIRLIFDKKAEKFKKLLALLKITDYHKCSNNELIRIFNRMVDEYLDTYTYGEPIAWLTKDAGECMEDYFRGCEEEFHTLITPPEKSFMQREHESMLKLAIGTGNLMKHSVDYEWIPYDYGAQAFSLNHFRKELIAAGKQKRDDLESELRRLKNYSVQLRKSQRNIYIKYGIDRFHEKQFEVLQHGSYLMDYKKEIFTRCHWYSRQLFSELGKRIGIPPGLVHYIFPFEMLQVVSGKGSGILERLSRRSEYVMIYGSSDGKLAVIEGSRAERTVNEFLSKYNEGKQVTEIRGRAAFRGVVTGRIRVILHAKDVGKLKGDEILVTSMTSPDYLIAVKKAKGIITDEGGITCHAAIVSRELGIPCIVGTGNATRALKTGDLVELNADKGLVKKK